MSVEPDQSSGGEPAGSEGRRFSTLIGSLASVTKTDRTAQADRVDQADVQAAVPARPTFTARASEPPTALTPEPPDVPEPGNSDSPGNPESAGSRVRRTPAADAPAAATSPAPAATSPAPVTPPPVAPAPVTPVTPAPQDEDDTRALPRPSALPAAALNEPLLSDAAGLRVRWQRVQAGFVDDPQEAVGDAADLIEQTAQALVGALRQRQRQLRVMWEGGPEAAASGNGEPAARASDTEHLRLMMQRYRALFNQLCP